MRPGRRACQGRILARRTPSTTENARRSKSRARCRACAKPSALYQPDYRLTQVLSAVILGLDPIGAKLTTNPPWHSPLHRHPRARPGDQSTLDVVKMIPGSSPGMTVQGAHAYLSAYGARPGHDTNLS